MPQKEREIAADCWYPSHGVLAENVWFTFLSTDAIASSTLITENNGNRIASIRCGWECATQTSEFWSTRPCLSAWISEILFASSFYWTTILNRKFLLFWFSSGGICQPPYWLMPGRRSRGDERYDSSVTHWTILYIDRIYSPNWDFSIPILH